MKTGRITKAKKNGNVNGGSPIKKEILLDEEEFLVVGGAMSVDEDGDDEV